MKESFPRFTIGDVLDKEGTHWEQKLLAYESGKKSVRENNYATETNTAGHCMVEGRTTWERGSTWYSWSTFIFCVAFLMKWKEADQLWVLLWPSYSRESSTFCWHMLLPASIQKHGSLWSSLMFVHKSTTPGFSLRPHIDNHGFLRSLRGSAYYCHFCWEPAKGIPRVLFPDVPKAHTSQYFTASPWIYLHTLLINMKLLRCHCMCLKVMTKW